MFSRIPSLVVAFALAASVVAIPHAGGGGSVSQCSGGQVNCCNTVQAANALDSPTRALFDLLHVGPDQLTGSVGFACMAANVLGVGGGSWCTHQQVCCNGNTFNGVIVLGCTPMNVVV